MKLRLIKHLIQTSYSNIESELRKLFLNVKKIIKLLSKYPKVNKRIIFMMINESEKSEFI